MLAFVSSQVARAIEHKHAEEALRESEARYRTLFERANDALFLETEQDEILDVNPRACELLGYSREELLALKVSDLQAPEMRGQFGSVIKGELTRSGGKVFEGIDVRRDGTRIPVEISTSQIGDSGLVLAIVRDITERTRAQAALRESEERERSLSHNLRVVVEAVDELITCADLDHFFRRAVELAREKLGVERCAIFLLDPTRQHDARHLWHRLAGPDHQRTGGQFPAR